MENNRIQILKEILLELHQGASPESVQERFNQHFKGVSALEISMMEHELMSSEDGVTFEDVMSFVMSMLTSLKELLLMWKWQTLIKRVTLSMSLNKRI